MSVQQWVEAYKDFLSVKDKGLVSCTVCNCDFKCARRSQINNHLNSAKHIGNVIKHEPSESEDTDFDFYKDLCEAFTAANIPLSKLNNYNLKNFLQKFCKGNVPAEITLIENYLDPVYNDKIEKIRQQITNKNLWFSVEETSDVIGRSLINVVIGALQTTCPSKPYLISCQIVQKVNATVISNTVKDSLLKVLPDLEPENVLLMITDDTDDMLVVGGILEETFPNLIQLTSLTRVLHGICELVQEEYTDVDNFINEIRVVLLQSLSRVSLPPEPIVTRPATWLEAAVFHAYNFEAVKNAIGDIEDPGRTIENCKQLLDDPQFISQLQFIKNTFGHIPQAIKQLEAHNLPLTDAMELFGKSLERIEIYEGFGKTLEDYILKFKNTEEFS